MKSLHFNTVYPYCGLFALLTQGIGNSSLSNLQVIPKTSKQLQAIFRARLHWAEPTDSRRDRAQCKQKVGQEETFVLNSHNVRLNIVSFTKYHFLLTFPIHQETL